MAAMMFGVPNQRALVTDFVIGLPTAGWLCLPNCK